MKFRRRNRTEPPSLEPPRSVLELLGVPSLPRDLTIHHTVERKPTAPPTQMWVVINDRAGYRFQGLPAGLHGYPGRVTLQVPTAAQIGLRDRETGEYVPLDRIEVEFIWERY